MQRERVTLLKKNRIVYCEMASYLGVPMYSKRALVFTSSLMLMSDKNVFYETNYN